MASAGIETYKHSGRIDAMTIPVGLAGGLTLGVAIAWVYQLAIDWIPYIYFNLLATVVFGIAVGAVMIGVLTKANCRNSCVAGILGFIVSCASLAASHYFAYTRVCDALAKKYAKTSEQIQAVYTFKKYVDDRVESGWQTSEHRSSSSDSAPTNGFEVWMVWALEALVVVGIGTALAALGNTDPFCEDCHAWTKSRSLGFRTGVSPERIRQALESGSLESVVLVPGGDPSVRGRIAYRVSICDICQQNCYLTIAHELVIKNIKGQNEFQTNTLLRQAMADQRILDKLRGTLDPTPEPTAATQSA